jgi:hypothetical protein
MKILKIFKGSARKRAEKNISYYQKSIEQAGRDQLQKLVEKGLTFQVPAIRA